MTSEQEQAPGVGPILARVVSLGTLFIVAAVVALLFGFDRYGIAFAALGFIFIFGVMGLVALARTLHVYRGDSSEQ